MDYCGEELFEWKKPASEMLRCFLKSGTIDASWHHVGTSSKFGSIQWVDELVDKVACRAAFQAAGDDFDLMCRHGTAKEKIPPKWLLEAWAAATGRRATFTDPLPMEEAIFFKRRLIVMRDQRSKRVFLQVPSLEDCLQTFVSPDRTDEAFQLDRTRFPAAVSRLVNAYPLPQAWGALGEVIVELLPEVDLSIDSEHYSYLSRSEEAQDVLPSVISLMTTRAICERLFRAVLPYAAWEYQVRSQAEASVIPQGLIQNWLGPELVFWFADENGMEASKQVAAAKVLYSVHGLWFSDHHEKTAPCSRVVPRRVFVGGWQTVRAF